MIPDNLSYVWSKVTDLEVSSGQGSWVTATAGERYLDVGDEIDLALTALEKTLVDVT